MIRALLAALILLTAIPAQADPVWIGEADLANPGQSPNRRYQYREPRNVTSHIFGVTVIWFFDGFVAGQLVGSTFGCLPDAQETICNTIANDLSHAAGPNLLTDDSFLDLIASDLIPTGKRKATAVPRFAPVLADDTTGDPCASLDILGCSIVLPEPTEGVREVTQYQFVYLPDFTLDTLYVLLYDGAELVYGIVVPEEHVAAAYPFYRSFLGDHGRIRVSTADGKLMTNRTSVGYKSSDPASAWFDMESTCTPGTFFCEPIDDVPPPGVYLIADFYQVMAAPFDYTTADGFRMWIQGFNLAGDLIQTNAIKTNDTAAWYPLEGEWGNHQRIDILPDGWTNTRPAPVGTTEALSAQPNPDIDGDGCVGIADFGILKSSLGQCADWNGWE